MMNGVVEVIVQDGGEVRVDEALFPQGTRIRIERLPAKTTPPNAKPVPPTAEELAEGDRIVRQMRRTLRLTHFDDPDGPAAPPEEWDALRPDPPDAEGGPS